jgi:hypothetical protein
MAKKRSPSVRQSAEKEGAHPSIESLVVFRSLQVRIHELTPKRLKARYELTLATGQVVETDLIYAFGEAVFNKNSHTCWNLASMMAVQVAFNYGLFCRELIFVGVFDRFDQRFILDMIENTSREIVVNKFLFPNEFLLPPVNHLNAEVRSKYTQCKIRFVEMALETDNKKLSAEAWTKSDPKSCLVLSSGGKDSLLTYGVMKELGFDAHPIFINESGRHWLTAKNAYEYLKRENSNTARVWCNSDRVFNWMLKHMPFVRKDFASVRADMYPIRLWTVAVFLFGVLPLARKRGLAYLLIGDEYDCTQKMSFKGITHYHSLYDQSKYFDNRLSRYFAKKGWPLRQFSILRSLSELSIMKILTKRYPHLQEQQISCHAAHSKAGRIYPCGNCEKCRRIVGMLKALGEDPGRSGYTDQQIANCLEALAKKSVKQIGPDASHLYYLLTQKSIIEKTLHSAKLARNCDFIMKLRFDGERSVLADIPMAVRRKVIPLFLKCVGGSVTFHKGKWIPVDILKDERFRVPYPFL